MLLEVPGEANLPAALDPSDHAIPPGRPANPARASASHPPIRSVGKHPQIRVASCVYHQYVPVHPQVDQFVHPC